MLAATPRMTPGLVEDRYAVVRPIGSGAHGQVFEATDRSTGERVALKHIRRMQGAPGGLGEFAAVLGVSHPCLVRCLDFHYLANGDTCLVYEYVGGGTLRELMPEGMPVPASLWELIARDILSALDHLHRNQILHCDLKPENILCLPLPEGGHRFMLSDLGVARYLHQRPALDYAATPAGAPAYMAPESFYHQFSPASDLYGLGVILFELASGRRPFEGDIRSIARGHLQATPPLELINESGQRDFARWLLHKDPSSRPRSATDALRRLDGLGPEAEVLASPLPAPALPSLQPLDAYEFDQEFTLHTLSHQHLPLTLHGRPALAALYDSHVELFDATSGRVLNRFLPRLPGVLQLHPDGTLLTAQPKRFVTWEGDYRMPRDIFALDGHPRAALLDATRRHLIWVENDHGFIRPLEHDSGPLRTIDCPASGLRPCLLVPRPGAASFILLPGTPRPEALWLDEKGVVLGRRLLPGPVVDCAHTQFPALFCATPGDLSATGLTLVVFGDPGEVTLLPFDQMPRFHCFCEDGVVLGDHEGVVTFIAESGRRRPLGRIDDPSGTLLFAPRREFYLSVNVTGHRSRYQLYRLP
jgi:serine/threonine protein kinase